MGTATTKRRRSPGPAQPGTGPTRIATLTRISTDEVNQSYSLDAQARGWRPCDPQPGQKITHRLVDQASGATLDRPDLQAALAAAKASEFEFDVLLVHRIDNSSHSIVGLMTIVEALDAAGVALRSATEPIDTHGRVGRMLLQLLGIFAEFERSLLIDRITKGFERKRHAEDRWPAPAHSATCSTPHQDPRRRPRRGGCRQGNLRWLRR